MKKIATLVVLLSSVFGFSQENDFRYPQDENKKTEVKLSVTSLIFIAALDASYERLINEDTSFGVSIFYNTDKNNDIDFPREFSITPYYRWFFNERTFARGFFVEGFGMLNTVDDSYYDNFYDTSGNFQSNQVKNTLTRFALGISVGGKFVIKNGFTAEVILGVGRNLLGDTDAVDFSEDNIIGRGGISLGYRF